MRLTVIALFLVAGCADAEPCYELPSCIDRAEGPCSPNLAVRVGEITGETSLECDGISASGICTNGRPITSNATYIDGERVRVLVHDVFAPPGFNDHWFGVVVPRSPGDGGPGALCMSQVTDLDTGDGCFSELECATSGTITVDLTGAGEADVTFDGGDRVQLRWNP